MENLKKEYEEELKNLEVKEDDEINQKVLSRKFKQKAFKVHSDKTGNTGEDKDEEFKKLLHDYQKVSEALKEVLKEDDDGDLRTFFDKHNVANECSQSWTILVENHLVSEWRTEMKKRFPNPTSVQGGGIQYKALVNGKIVSVTHYENPSDNISKMNVQGNLESLKTFVIEIMPEINKSVSDAALKKSKAKIHLNTRVKNSGTFSCDECDKTYTSKGGLRSHIKLKHELSEANLSDTSTTEAKTAEQIQKKKKVLKERLNQVLPPISDTPIPLKSIEYLNQPPKKKKSIV